MTPMKHVLAVLAIVGLSLAAGSSAVAAPTTCTTRGLLTSSSARRVTGLEVAALTTSGVSCSRAVELARPLATEIALGHPLSLSGSVGLAMSETTPCAGCATDTMLTLTLADGGSVSLSLKGHLDTSTSIPSIPVPQIPGFPGSPFPTPTTPGAPSAGSGSGSQVY
jgi:hypothetical protein